MKQMRKILMAVICMFCCIFCMGTAVYANEDTSVEYDVILKNWNRRIYDLCFSTQDVDTEAYAIRVYAGKNYHLTDGEGEILSEGVYIDANGNITDDKKGGLVSRDKNGWYVLWEEPELDKMTEQHVFVQAHVEFVGGNNQTLSVKGLSGLYASKDDSKPALPMAFEDIIVNVASEVDVSDTEVPVMYGMNVASSAFLSKAVVKMDAVYGDIRDIPIEVQWYRVDKDTNGKKTETAVSEPIKSMPYYIPETEFEVIANESSEYLVKVFYMGEASTEEAKKNTDGRENKVSETEAMDQAVFKTELIKGHIDIAVQLERLPYNNSSSSNSFSYRLYRFDQQNQVIQNNTPYTVYTVTFEKEGNLTTQHLHIEDLEAGWYTLVPEIPRGDFVEKAEYRTDNRGEDGRIGNSAGVDFHIGQIIDNAYSWEIIRYQGQDTSDALGDNFFKVTYVYKENLYGVTYKANAPEGTKAQGMVPVDSDRYREGSAFSVQGGDGLTIDGWQFVGWSLEAGDGQYYNSDVLYSDQSVNGIPVNTRATMTEDGLTLYAKWIPVYEVNYHGNTYTEGTLPTDTKGTVVAGSNVYYSGDSIIVQSPGNIKKYDDDGVKYEFNGWSLSQDGTGNRYYEGDRIFIESSDLTLYAQWKAVGTDKFAVNYIAVIPKGASLLGQLPSDNDKYAVGNVVKVKGKGTMDVQHYRFAGWSLTSNEDGLYVEGEEIFGTNDIGDTVTREETVMKEQGLSFYSRWIPLYQVTYDANSNVTDGIPYDANEYEANDPMIVLSGDEMVREGYTFVGWNTKMDGSGQSYDAGMTYAMPDENIELYAQWEEIPKIETESGTDDTSEKPGMTGTIPLVILSIIGTACVTAFVVYQIMRRRG